MVNKMTSQRYQRRQQY